MASIVCPKCKSKMAYVPELAGQAVACPACNQRFRSPKIETPAAVATAPVRTAPPLFPPVPTAPVPATIAPAPVAIAPAPVAIAPAPELQAPPSFQLETTQAAPALPPFTREVKATFRPREYPAMRIIIVVLYVLAGLVATQFVLSTVLMMFSAGGGMLSALTSSGPEADGAQASAIFSLVGFCVVFLVSLVFHGMFVIMFMASAESIKIWIDIQRNTQEAAHYVKAGQTAA